jgi:hypothetical protein
MVGPSGSLVVRLAAQADSALAESDQAAAIIRATQRWSGAPIDDLQVLVLARPGRNVVSSAITNPLGTARIGMPPGRYRLRLQFIGYVPLESAVRLRAGYADTVVAALQGQTCFGF